MILFFYFLSIEILFYLFYDFVTWDRRKVKFKNGDYFEYGVCEGLMRWAFDILVVAFKLYISGGMNEIIMKMYVYVYLGCIKFTEFMYLSSKLEAL